ncbi:hypothetical protein IAR55_003982 [Kwoniella newhampshirensis]|uniref:GH18 domain-containing protein n=1 Tax=Kwoniella newhampshirensis TaxID=1651941 RepID=A0AAW0YM91_9TREE
MLPIASSSSLLLTSLTLLTSVLPASAHRNLPPRHAHPHPRAHARLDERLLPITATTTVVVQMTATATHTVWVQPTNQVPWGGDGNGSGSGSGSGSGNDGESSSGTITDSASPSASASMNTVGESSYSQSASSSVPISTVSEPDDAGPSLSLDSSSIASSTYSFSDITSVATSSSSSSDFVSTPTSSPALSSSTSSFEIPSASITDSSIPSASVSSISASQSDTASSSSGSVRSSSSESISASTSSSSSSYASASAITSSSASASASVSLSAEEQSSSSSSTTALTDAVTASSATSGLMSSPVSASASGSISASASLSTETASITASETASITASETASITASETESTTVSDSASSTVSSDFASSTSSSAGVSSSAYNESSITASATSSEIVTSTISSTSASASASSSSSSSSDLEPLGSTLMNAYYPDWSGYYLAPESVDWSRFDVVDFAFALPTSDFGLEFTQDDSASLLTRLVSTAHAAGKRVKLSIGGWTGSAYFSTICSTSSNRRTFINNILAAYNLYNLDGIDIDWEYPGTGGADGNAVSGNDSANFLRFLTELRAALPEGALISTATQVWPFADSNGRPMTDVSGFAKVIDWILIMNYDVWGSSSTPGANAPLSDGCGNSTQPLANAYAAVASWTAAGMPANQITLGVPAYGYLQKSAATQLKDRRRSFPMPPHKAAANLTALPRANYVTVYNDNGGSADGQVMFESLISQGALVWQDGEYVGGNGFTREWDSCSSTPWIKSTRSGQIVTYDDPASMSLKGQFAAQAGLRGCNVFSIDGDWTGNSWPLTDAVRSGLGL